MIHGHGLIATIAIGLAAAFFGGFLATRLRLPAIVGYLLSLTGLPARDRIVAAGGGDVAAQREQEPGGRQLRARLLRAIQFSGAPSSSRIAAKSIV